MKKRFDWLMSVLLFVLLLTGCMNLSDSDIDQKMVPNTMSSKPQIAVEGDRKEDPSESDGTTPLSEEGWYSSKEEVAAYIHQFGKLPSNYLTKKEATQLGWESKKGNLWKVAKGKSIGGDRFGNREKILPDVKGRKWYECDIGYTGSFRNKKRIVYSSDGLIYYTEDHYKSFEQLY